MKGAFMEKEALGQKRQLEKLENAAEHAAEPDEIQQKAEKPENDPNLKTPAFWFVPYLIACAVAGAGMLLLDWKPSLFNPSLADKIHRYLLGALGVVGVLALERGL